MEREVIQQVRTLIYESPLIKYINIKDIEIALSNIHFYSTDKEFMNEYGKHYEGGQVYGFNRNGISYFPPKTEAHTVIHEVLHTLSSEFDEDGHRIKNGIQGNNEYRFSNQVNEGLTDFLANQISGKNSLIYKEGKRFFEKLNPGLTKIMKKQDVLFDMYINNKTEELKDFLDKYGGQWTFSKIYNDLLFMNDAKMDAILNMIDKNVNKQIKRENRLKRITDFLTKVKGIFLHKKDYMLQLPREMEELKKNKRKSFIEQNKVKEIPTVIQKNGTKNDLSIEKDDYTI